MKITIPNIDIINMHIVYHWILQVLEMAGATSG